MDLSPHPPDISEDSGCLTLTTSENSSSMNCGASSRSHYLETPTTTLSSSRKRKISQYDHRLIHKDDLESSSYESPAIFKKDLANPPHFLSSTLNESLSKSLEKCNLGDYTPNFYVERSPSEFDNEHSLKRYKLDESPKYQPKTRSAPSTPTKHLETEELQMIEKSRSEHLTNYYYTPDRNGGYSSEKLGNTERLTLLYPTIQATATPPKLKTPEKLRDFIKKFNSPAKKRLFEYTQGEKKYFRKIDRDPIVFFTVKNDFRHIISKIFGYLSDSDLCTVCRVSKTWKRALKSDYKAFPRYYTYSREYNSNKENVLMDISGHDKSPSPPGSPERDNFQKCTRIVSRLQPSQSLQKCLQCMEPAVLQKTISQCQNPNCEYIYCTSCLSFSTTGPENFVDKCQASELLIGNKQNTSKRFSLYDISNGTSASPSFLFNNSMDTPQSKYDSSGYLSESDISPIVKVNHSFSMETKPLKEVSLNKINSCTRRKSRRSSLVSVVSAVTTPKIVEITEPSSPPKIKTVACSKQSKKNLKRLHF